MLLLAALHFLLTLALLARLGRAAWARRHYTLEAAPSLEAAPTLTVVVPARDEEARIGACLSSLLAQDYPRERLRVVLVDDSSQDRTLEIASMLQAQDERLEIVSAPELPRSWTGKNHACHVGAVADPSEWICFVDADTASEPGLLRAAIAYGLDHAVDLVSLSPRQALEGLSERFFLPGIFLQIAASMDFLACNQVEGETAVANGQFLLFRRASYDAFGGHEAVKNQVLEDLAFARGFRAQGLRPRFLFGEAFMTTRMYGSVSEIFFGFSKNLSEILELSHPLAVSLEALQSGLLAWGGLLVLALESQAGGVFSPAGTLAWISQGIHLGIGIGIAREFRIPWIYGLALPAAWSFYALLVLESARRRIQKSRVWKGRTYS